MEYKIINILQIKALNKDGEKPANQTNIINAITRIINVVFFRPNLFPKKIAIEENIDKCIPDNASM